MKSTVLAALVLAILPHCAYAAPIELLHSFGVGIDGTNPFAGVTFVGDVMYGTTQLGGTSNNGMLYRMDADGGNYTLRHFFTGGSDGSLPAAKLTVVGTTLVGTTASGGNNAGTMFSIAVPSGPYVTETFSGVSNNPVASLIQVGSRLYGTSAAGGTLARGNVYRVQSDLGGIEQVYSFQGGSTDGLRPSGTVTPVGSALFGTTTQGGPSNAGVIYAVNTDGSAYHLVHTFSGSDGRRASGDLALVGSTLYGTTQEGGASNRGVMFSMNLDGSNFHVLHSFAGGSSDGARPNGYLTLAGGQLYGMTAQGGLGTGDRNGTIFAMNLDGSNYQVVHMFAGGANDGKTPLSGLTLHGSTLYGTTSVGGLSDKGTVFALAVPEPSSIGLLAAGLAILAGVARRNRRLAA